MGLYRKVGNPRRRGGTYKNKYTTMGGKNMKLIHLSDLHFHRRKADNSAATKTLGYVKKQYPNHGLVVTGDIVDDGHEEQYERAFDALKNFMGRIYISPGNHDFGAAGNFYSQERAERFDEMLSIPLQQGGTFTGDNTPVVHIMEEDTDRVMLIALDSNLETAHPFDFACGEIGNEQLTALDTILSNPSTADVIKILFLHHHPFMHGNPFMELKDAYELMRSIYCRVHAVLFGHKHVSNQWENMNGIPYVLASDNSPGKDWAREITIEHGVVTVNDVKIA
jgi:3',5'-cyclic AMP phosphodiesterase CpdA